eukprot:1260726-Prymnesium_polylepis.1
MASIAQPSVAVVWQPEFASFTSVAVFVTHVPLPVAAGGFVWSIGVPNCRYTWRSSRNVVSSETICRSRRDVFEAIANSYVTHRACSEMKLVEYRELERMTLARSSGQSTRRRKRALRNLTIIPSHWPRLAERSDDPHTNAAVIAALPCARPRPHANLTRFHTAIQVLQVLLAYGL